MKKKMLIWLSGFMAVVVAVFPISSNAGEKADDFWKFYEKYPHMQDFYPFGIYGSVLDDDKYREIRADLSLEIMNDYYLNITWSGIRMYQNKRWKEGDQVTEITPFGDWLLGQEYPRYGIKALPTLIQWTQHKKEVFSKYRRLEPLLNESEMAEVESVLNSPIQGAGDSAGKEFPAPLRFAADLAKKYTNSIVGFITDDEPGVLAPAVAAVDLVEKYTGLPAAPCYNDLPGVVRFAKHRTLVGGDWYTDPWSNGKNFRELNRQCPDNIFWFIPLVANWAYSESTKADLRDERPFREEYRLQVWQAVALGCKGFFPYLFNWGYKWAAGDDGLVDALLTPDYSNRLMEEVGALGKDLTAIGPLLLSCRAETNFTVKVSCKKVHFPLFEGPALDYGLLKDVKHDRFFLVPWNNDIRREQKGTLLLPEQLLAGRKVYDLMALQKIDTPDNKLEVTLLPGGGRIYLLGAKSEFAKCGETISRHRVKPIKVQALVRYDIARTNGVDLVSAGEILAKAGQAEKSEKWDRARDLYLQAREAIEDSEKQTPVFEERQKLKNTAAALSRTDDLLRTHVRVLEIYRPWYEAFHNHKILFTNQYVGKEIKEWTESLVNDYYEAQGRFRSGKGGPSFPKELTELEARAVHNADSVQAVIDQRLKELRKPIKIAYITSDRDEREYIMTYAWAMDNCYLAWIAPDGKGNLADMQGKLFKASDYDEIWIHQLRYNEPPARGRVAPPTQALMPELMQPATIKVLREYIDKGGGMLLSGVASIYTMPLGLETNAPDRFRENSKYPASEFGLGLIPTEGYENHPLFKGFSRDGFYTSGNAHQLNLVTECAWEERKPAGIVLANELDEKLGRQADYAAVVEYHAGKGKILVMGGKSCDLTPEDCPGAHLYNPFRLIKEKYAPILRDTFRQLTLNALVYLSSKDVFKTEPAKIGADQSNRIDLPANGWLTCADPNRSGVTEGWYRPEYETKGWEATSMDIVLKPQVNPTWFRQNFVTANRPDRKTLLWFEGVLGEISVYVNGQIVGSRTNRHEKAEAMEITEVLNSSGSNHVLAIYVNGSAGMRCPASLFFTKMTTNETPLQAVVKMKPGISAVIPRVVDAGGDPARVDWTHSLALGNWYTVTGTATDQEIKSYLAHDGKYLYIQLDHLLNGIQLKSSAEVWGGDVWEIYFATSRYEPPKRQLAVNVLGKYACLRYGEETETWDSGVKVISTADAAHWRIVLALPLDKLMPDGVKAGDAFYANFYRQVIATEELLAWSPNFIAVFSEQKRMGKFTLGS